MSFISFPLFFAFLAWTLENTPKMREKSTRTGDVRSSAHAGESTHIKQEEVIHTREERALALMRRGSLACKERVPKNAGRNPWIQP